MSSTTTSPSPATYPHKWWAIVVCLVLALGFGLGTALVLLAFHMSAVTVVLGGFGGFAASNNVFLNHAKAAGLVH